MQKLLKRQQGFTLVELLVVIAIIAILAVIGLTVFTGLQRGARDAARRADVESISKALEANYSTTNAQYIPMTTSQFAGQVIPLDPLNNQTQCGTGGGGAAIVCQYCILAVSGNAANPSGGNCPLAGGATVAANTPIAGTTGYVVCTNLEVGTPTFYCRGSQR